MSKLGSKNFKRQAAWEHVKQAALESGKKITRKVPFWLSLPDINGGFVVNDGSVAVVKLIFELAKSGLGSWKICQELNRRGIASPYARKNENALKTNCGWGTSSVRHIIKSKAVIGDLIIDRESDKPRVVHGYYPRVIDDALFAEAQPKSKLKTKQSSQLKTNLFTNLLWCDYCGSSMQVDTNTQNGVRRSTIACQNHRRGLGCTSKTWRYEEFERSFFTFIDELDVAGLSGGEDAVYGLKEKIRTLDNKISDFELRLEKLNAAGNKSGYPDKAVDRINDLELSRAKEIRDKSKFEIELVERTQKLRRIKDRNLFANDLYGMMQSFDTSEIVKLRKTIAEKIREVVTKIKILANGSGLALVKEIVFDEHNRPVEIKYPPNTIPTYTVELKDGFTRSVAPSRNYNSRIDFRRPPRMKKF